MILEMAIASFLKNKIKKSQKPPKKKIDLAIQRKKEHTQYDP
jgi:phage-related protein